MALTKVTQQVSSTPGISDSSNATAITIDSSERVGIGTSSPGTILHTRTSDATSNNNAGGGFYHVSSATAGSRKASLFLDADNGNFSTSSDGAYAYLEKIGGGGAFNIRQQDSSNIGFYISSNEKMRLASNGNLTLSDSLGVGTGTTAPNSRLQIKKDGTSNYANQTFSNANSTAGITFGIAGSGTGNYLANNAFLLNTGASALIFGTGDTEKMRIADDGKVFIATTTAARTTDGHEFHTDGFARHTVDGDKSLELVRRTSFGEMLEFFKDTSLIGSIGAYTTGRLYIGSGDTGITFASDYESIYPINTTTQSARDDAVSLGYISGGRFDDIVATNGTIQTSDQKEKNTIMDSDLGLDFVKKLSPKSYKFNGKTRTHYGLIAQDVETVLSDISKPATDFAGFIKSDISEEQDGSTYRYGLRYNEFISPLIKAIQEQQVIIDDLKARIETLEE